MSKRGKMSKRNSSGSKRHTRQQQVTPRPKATGLTTRLQVQELKERSELADKYRELENEVQVHVNEARQAGIQVALEAAQISFEAEIQVLFAFVHAHGAATSNGGGQTRKTLRDAGIKLVAAIKNLQYKLNDLPKGFKPNPKLVGVIENANHLRQLLDKYDSVPESERVNAQSEIAQFTSDCIQGFDNLWDEISKMRADRKDLSVTRVEDYRIEQWECIQKYLEGTSLTQEQAGFKALAEFEALFQSYTPEQAIKDCKAKWEAYQGFKYTTNRDGITKERKKVKGSMKDYVKRLVRDAPTWS